MNVDVKNGKIVRIRPLHYDQEYDPKEYRPWKIKARGKTFEPLSKNPTPAYCFAYKKRAYSPNRVKYPLKRVDWDPKGDRHPENRGKSGYVRISWDEALELIASEIKRIKEKYGPYAVLSQGDGHGETKTVHGPHGCQDKLLELLGGYTKQARNPDSWEGWYWGAKHAWGMDENFGNQEGLTNTILDLAENTELLLNWGSDPETTTWGLMADQTPSRLLYWFSELGIKQIYICPNLNYAAAIHADKWIPIRPNTDAALQLAIAYVWITKETYDKEYVETHTYGFEEFKKYVLGEEDNTPKTPEWAEKITGVPARIIKSLAREWASKRTSIMHGLGGGMIRGQYSTEPARLEVLLLAMQGIGKPGANQITTSLLGRVEPELPGPQRRAAAIPRAEIVPNTFKAYTGWFIDTRIRPLPKQFIPKTLIAEAILDPPISWYGNTIGMERREDQFNKYTYPVEGCSEIHMIWTDTPCLITCWNDSNTITKAYRSPKIEFFLAQHPWVENDCLLADIILPVSTVLELDDIGIDGGGAQFNSIFFEEKAIEPIGESKSDYEIVCMVAEKLGLLNEYTGERFDYTPERKTVGDLIRYGFETSGMRDLISWEKLKEKKYFVSPTDPDWEKYTPGMRDFYDKPEKNPLNTPTGKIEFYATGLAEHFPDDKERPPVPHWIPYGESHQESLEHFRAKKYPLLMVSPHPRWRIHANLDDITWLREIPTCKVRGPDGYQYEPVWIHPKDAEERDIKHGDIVKVYNERGTVLAGAYVTERVISGVVNMAHGARYDPIVLGELDRGGAINTITPSKTTSKNASGMVVNGFLVEIEPADLGELIKKYPEAFKKPYHPAAGLCRERVLEG